MRKLTKEQAAEIKERYERGGVTQRELAAEYNVTQQTITRVCNPESAQKTRERNRRSQATYTPPASKQFLLNLNRTADADVIEKLESVLNKQGYIKELIRKDIDNSKKEENLGK